MGGGGYQNGQAKRAVNLKKNPPIREVVYTISPFELDIMSALWKEFPRKVAANFKRTGPNLLGFCILPVAATVWYADNYREHEKYEHRY